MQTPVLKCEDCGGDIVSAEDLAEMVCVSIATGEEQWRQTRCRGCGEKHHQALLEWLDSPI